MELPHLLLALDQLSEQLRFRPLGLSGLQSRLHLAENLRVE